jgi:hypothetical protein
MEEIKRYITVRDSNFKDLDKAVNEKIQAGWQPFGSPYVTDGEEFLACQAMVSIQEEDIPVIDLTNVPNLKISDLSLVSSHDDFNRKIQNLPTAKI